MQVNESEPAIYFSRAERVLALALIDFGTEAYLQDQQSCSKSSRVKFRELNVLHFNREHTAPLP